MSPYILENCVNFSPVLFGGFGQKPTFEKFLSVYGQFYRKKPRKSGQKPGFENQKWAEKFGGIF